MANNIDTLTDPLWEYVLETRLRQYIQPARDWWSSIEKLDVIETGLFTIPNGPPGFMWRFTRTVKRSPIAGIQAFPLVPTSYLPITGIQGGVVKMIERVCQDDKFMIDEFMIIEKHNLPSTYNAGQFLAFIPEHIYNSRELGKWIYLTDVEIMNLVVGHVTKEIQDKLKLKI